MEINLNLIKFHSFNKSKIHNNLSTKDWKKKLHDFFFDDFLDVLKKIRQAKNIPELSNCLLHYHEITGNSKTHLYYIVDKCHPNLYMDIFQIMDPDSNWNDINFYQCKLQDKRTRLIFIIYTNPDDNLVVAPIIFDLKHCIYTNQDKAYDDNKCNEIYAWDFKSQQENIKKNLKELI